MKIVAPEEHAVRQIEERVVAAYRARFAAEPTVVSSAPGRVNLLGEHTDYNGGFVLPCAIDRRTAVALGPAVDSGAMADATTLYSLDYSEARPLASTRTHTWVDYPSGAVWALKSQGFDAPAFRAVFASDVPQGAGLSSSAAIEAVTTLALDRLAGLQLGHAELALLCKRAENEFVGVPSGIMDQYSVLFCEAGAALLLDCRSLAVEPVPLDLEKAGLRLVVCDTKVKRRLAATDSGYPERVATCERAARLLGVKQLRDATEADLPRLSGKDLQRARHVVKENERVLAGATALRAADFAEFGRLMYASHASLRDDYEVSIAELDTFVEVAREMGALGARLTGAGFGGCAIALIASELAPTLTAAVDARFANRAFLSPDWYVFSPSAGAEAFG